MQKVKLKNIIDTWNMIGQYRIFEWQTSGNAIIISKQDFDKMLELAKNKKYIKNLLVK